VSRGLAEVVVDGESGVLVPSDDVPALAGAIARLLSEPAYRARIAAGGHARFEERFTNEAMVRAWMDCWAELAPAPKTG
jgi:glycosyltransferase involved in cell wall biosynthesis